MLNLREADVIAPITSTIKPAIKTMIAIPDGFNSNLAPCSKPTLK